MLQSITVPTAGQLAEDRALGLGVVSGITSWGQWDSLGPVPGDRERMMHAACLGAASTTEPFGFTTDIRFTQLGRGRDQSSLLSDLHLQNPRIPSARCFSSSALSPSCCGLCWCPALGCPAFPSQQCSHPTQHTDTATCTAWHLTLHPLLSHPQPRGAACAPNPCISSYYCLGR